MAAARRGPTLRAQLLGKKLREMREQAHLTLKAVAEHLQRDSSTVSRIESGQITARLPDVLAYLDICGEEDPQRREALKYLSQDAFQKGWWEAYPDDVSEALQNLVWLESRMRDLRVFHAVVLPGLLQTRDYAEAVIRAADPEATDDQIQHWVDLRMARQKVLEQPDPPQFHAVVDEAVLRRVAGSNQVMCAQLDHLRDLAGRPNIEVMVLPIPAGMHASPDGSFVIFGIMDPYQAIGLCDTPIGEVFIEAEAAERLVERYDRLRAMAVGEKQALALIANARKDLT